MERDTQPRLAYASAFAIPLVLYLVAALLSIALVTAQTALSMLCMLALFTAAAAKLWSLFSLARVSCQLSMEKPRLFAGETLELRAHVDNDKLLPIWLQVNVPISDAAQQDGSASFTLNAATGLLSYQSSRLRWQRSGIVRGVHTLGPTELVATDPLGFYSQTKWTQKLELVVYPRLVPLLPVLLPRRDLLGQLSADSQIEDPTYVHGVREYNAGRAARHIHWKASARVQRLVEKVFERSSHERVLLLLRAENFAQAGSGALFERALEALASLAVELDRRGIPVGLATNCALQGSSAQRIRPGRAPGQLAQLLEILARAQPRVALDMAQLSERVSSNPLTTLVFFSYELDDELSAWLRRLAMRQKTLSVFCRAETQANLPMNARATSLDALVGKSTPPEASRGSSCSQ